MSTTLEITIRLAAALLLGGAIGMEREYRSKDAGFRTHFLVALGSALFTIISQYGFTDGLRDSSRIAAQIVSGIGFLGAGIIIFQKNMVRGLTTAAGLWVTAAIGMACGTGMYAVAAITTALVLIGLEVLHVFVRPLDTTVAQVSFHAPTKELAHEVIEKMASHHTEIIAYAIEELQAAESKACKVTLTVKTRRRNHNKHIMGCLRDLDNVQVTCRD